MSIQSRGGGDSSLDQVMGALKKYECEHPHARIEVYRYSSVSIRVRVVAPDFAGIPRGERHEIIWRLLQELPEETQSQMSLLILLTPQETEKSFASFEFDHPVPLTLWLPCSGPRGLGPIPLNEP